MQKMPIIFDMTFDNEGEREVLHTIREEIRDLVNTTLAEGKQVIPTFKRDGTAVFCNADGKWFTRRAVKTGKQAPEGFIALETDPNTGTTFGWEPKDSSPMKKFLNKAIDKINGNPERVDAEELRIHGQEKATDFPTIQDIIDRDEPFEMLKPIFADFRAKHIEGVVFWIADEDGNLIEPRFKVRRKDFFPEMDTRPKPSRNRRHRGCGKRR